MNAEGCSGDIVLERRNFIFATVMLVLLFACAGTLFVLRDTLVSLITDKVQSFNIPAGNTANDTLLHDLAFMSNKAGTWDIFLLSTDGTLKNLTSGTENDAAFDYFPSWALDGKQINFLSNRLSSAELGPSQVNPDGTGLQNLDVVSAIMSLAMSRRFDWDPAWSPDGKQLLWSSLRDLNLELYVIDMAATINFDNARNLTGSGARDWFSAWSPAGTQAAYASDSAGNENVYRLEISSGISTALTDSPWDELRAAWSLTGDSLLYIYDEKDALLEGTVNFYLMGVDGSEKRPLGDAVFEGGAVWSPDGSQVAYISNADGNWQLYVMNADGSNKRRITEPGADYLYPVWRP